MKKFLLSLVGIFAAVSSAFAITPFVEFQPVIAGGSTCRFNVQGGVHEMMTKNIGLGAGIGITEQWNFDNGPLIPIFVRGDISGQVGGFKPFFSLDLGYAINTENTDWGAVVVNPMVGLDFGKVYAGIGYQALCWTHDGAGATNCFNMKIGYKF
ncbi:MAG: hypothetical protein K2K93_00830 [Muribaculaceae bacterium]|nr:hypothetical protein [Muribaculaceae bacterium]